MSEAGDDSLYSLVALLKQHAPEYLNIFAAPNDADFENAFCVLLEKAISGLETNKKHFKELSEDGLSAVLAQRLSLPGLSVTRETHSNGHVDLTITISYSFPQRRKLCEAKIWDGPKYHIDGLEQLLKRYATGREGRGFVIAYVKKPNIAGLFAKLRKIMDEKRPCGQIANANDYVLKWSFVSPHAHSCGDTLEVGHVGCNLYIDPV